MNFILTWLLEQPQLVAFVQVFLDLILIIVFFLVVFRRPKKDDSDNEFSQSLGKILEETQTIAQEFDTNLKERRELINQIVATLDHKIQEAKQMCQNLENLKQQIKLTGTSRVSASRNQENQAILHLARKGLNAAAIAERLQKPLGEVEMVLSLKRLTAEP